MPDIPSYAHHIFRPLDPEADWDKPRRLDPKAKLAGERWRVLVEGDLAVMDLETREDLLTNINFCSSMDWLIVTEDPSAFPWTDYPQNLWRLVRVRTQADANERIPKLLAAPAAVRGVLIEGCAEIVDLKSITWKGWRWNTLTGHCSYGGVDAGLSNLANRIDWLVLSGDAGPDARPLHIERVQSLVGQCRIAGVSVWMDRLGSRPMYDTGYDDGGPASWPQKDPDGADPNEWPVDLRVRELPMIGGGGV